MEILGHRIMWEMMSPFSSPVLLVKKHDGTWCFCVDFRALNEKTVKNKFPIPIVDELLDELKGACFFTKLDLRNGYYQVRMHPNDVAKIAECTSNFPSPHERRPQALSLTVRSCIF
jgi:hypothetical protein